MTGLAWEARGARSKSISFKSRRNLGSALAVAVVLATSACAGSTFTEPIIGIGGHTTSSRNVFLSEQDIAMADDTLATALEFALSGRSANWQNPATGNQGAYQVMRTFEDDRGRVCRDYVEMVYVMGRARTGVPLDMNIGSDQKSYAGSACRDLDGRWKKLLIGRQSREGLDGPTGGFQTVYQR